MLLQVGRLQSYTIHCVRVWPNWADDVRHGEQRIFVTVKTTLRGP